MNNGRTSLAALVVCAWAAAAAASLWAAWSFGVATPDRIARLTALAADREALAALAAESRRFEPHWRALESAGEAGPPPPQELFAAAAPGAPAPIVSAETITPLNDRWQLRKIDLAMAEIPIDSLAAFLHACATARPPWRVSAMRLQALDAGSTRARATLTLEGAAVLPPGAASP